MSPFLTTLGGGSARGFGRAFRRIISGPTTVAPTAIGAYPPSYEAYNNLTVYWSDAINTGASYQVYFDGVLKTTTATNVYSVNIGSLTANTSYSIYVIAVKNGVSSVPSVAVNASTHPCWTNNQLITTYCDGYANRIEVRGSGTCGYVYYNNQGNDVPLCGHIPYGTYLYPTCVSSTEAGAVYANGNGGTYTQVNETCSPSYVFGNYTQFGCCNGSCYPVAGSLVNEGCLNCQYVMQYADGCGGYTNSWSPAPPGCGGYGCCNGEPCYENY